MHVHLKNNKMSHLFYGKGGFFQNKKNYALRESFVRGYIGKKTYLLVLKRFELVYNKL